MITDAKEKQSFLLTTTGTSGRISDNGNSVHFDDQLSAGEDFAPTTSQTLRTTNARPFLGTKSIILSKRDLQSIHHHDSETEKLQQIWVFCESQRQMHKLAYCYFQARDFYFNFLPIVVLTFISGALSFFITTDAIAETDKTYLGIAVGLVSVLSVAVQSIAKESNYSARSELHRNAALGMKTLRDEIDFQLVDPNLEVNPTLASADVEVIDMDELDDNIDTNNTCDAIHPVPKKGKKDSTKGTNNAEGENTEAKPNETTVETYRRISMQILDSCKSVVPLKISQPFLLVDSRLTLELSNKDHKKRLYRKHGKMAEQLLAASWYNELFVQISNYWAWPMVVPHPDNIVDAAKEVVVETFTEDSAFLVNVVEGCHRKQHVDVTRNKCCPCFRA